MQGKLKTALNKTLKIIVSGLKDMWAGDKEKKKGQTWDSRFLAYIRLSSCVLTKGVLYVKRQNKSAQIEINVIIISDH